MTLEQALNGAVCCAKENNQSVMVFYDSESASYEFGAAQAVALVWPKFRPSDCVTVISPAGEVSGDSL